jgi:hypothetical protein
MQPFQSNQEIETLIEKFNTCSLPAEAWTHEAHLAMGVWYLRQYTLTQAMLLVRQRIILFNSSVGGPWVLSEGITKHLLGFGSRRLRPFLTSMDVKKPY